MSLGYAEPRFCCETYGPPVALAIVILGELALLVFDTVFCIGLAYVAPTTLYPVLAVWVLMYGLGLPCLLCLELARRNRSRRLTFPYVFWKVAPLCLHLMVGVGCIALLVLLVSSPETTELSLEERELSVLIPHLTILAGCLLGKSVVFFIIGLLFLLYVTTMGTFEIKCVIYFGVRVNPYLGLEIRRASGPPFQYGFAYGSTIDLGVTSPKESSESREQRKKSTKHAFSYVNLGKPKD